MSSQDSSVRFPGSSRILATETIRVLGAALGGRSSGLVPGSQRAFLRERWSQPGIQGSGRHRKADERRSGCARFAGFAAVALQDVRAAGDELERAVSQLGFKGAMINGYSHIGDMDTAQYLDEPPVARVEALDVPVYLHRVFG